MSVLSKLARAQGRRDEKPNVVLAVEIAARGDRKAIAELVAAIPGGSVAVQGDAIKAIYETGERNPKLVAPHAKALLALLPSRNNCLVWGVLSALDTIAVVEAATLHRQLSEILRAAEASSVIAKDKTVSILCKLSRAGYAKTTLPILIDLLKDAAVNQLPMYAEGVAGAVTPSYVPKLRAVLEARLRGVTQASKRKRLERVLRTLRPD
jgi:hypothetical protein